MWDKIIELIKKLFNVENTRLTAIYNDEDVQSKIRIRDRDLQLLQNQIGKNPMDQIDWIITNGYEKYFELYKSYEDGSIGKKDSVGEGYKGDDYKVINDMFKSIASYGYAVDELSQGAKSLVNYGQDEEGRVEYVNTSYDTLRFKGRSNELYSWDGYGYTQYVRLTDVDDTFKSDRFNKYLEEVIDEDAYFTVRGGLENKVIHRVRNNKGIKSTNISYLKGAMEEKEMQMWEQGCKVKDIDKYKERKNVKNNIETFHVEKNSLVDFIYGVQSNFKANEATGYYKGECEIYLNKEKGKIAVFKVYGLDGDLKDAIDFSFDRKDVGKSLEYLNREYGIKGGYRLLNAEDIFENKQNIKREVSINKSNDLDQGMSM